MDVAALTDSELRTALVEYNVYTSPPPVGATTRSLLERKLQRAVDASDQGNQIRVEKVTRKSASPKKAMSPPKKSPRKQKEATPFDDDDGDDYRGEESFEAREGSPLYPTLTKPMESPYMKSMYNRQEEIGVLRTPTGGKAYIAPKKPRKFWTGNFTGWPRKIVFALFVVFLALVVFKFGGRFMDEFAPDWHAFTAPFQPNDQIE